MFGFMIELVRWNRYKGMILRANKPDDVQFYDCSKAITNTKLKRAGYRVKSEKSWV